MGTARALSRAFPTPRIAYPGRAAIAAPALNASLDKRVSANSFLRARNILVLPSVTNIVDGVWDGALVSRIIADPALRSANITQLVQLALDKAYDGIDLDYENLARSDRTAFSTFVDDLAAALHERGKLLTVNVYGKTSDPGTWDGPMAQDWASLGAAADQVRIMTYEYHWSTSSPGPVAPIEWVGQVLSFARSAIPAHKCRQCRCQAGTDRRLRHRGGDVMASWGRGSGCVDGTASPVRNNRATRRYRVAVPMSQESSRKRQSPNCAAAVPSGAMRTTLAMQTSRPGAID